LRPLDGDEWLADAHRLHAVRGHPLEMDGERDKDVAHYRAAARRTTSQPEKRYLDTRAAGLAPPR
jgi:predicted RNA polymerase sigma factor